MESIKYINREKLIEFYIAMDASKKGIPKPLDYDTAIWKNWNDPNMLDQWLQDSHYKHGVIPGFRKWAYVQLSNEDLLNCAIVNSIGIFKDLGQYLRNLSKMKEFQEWKPDRKADWYNPLSQGNFNEHLSIILRPACGNEKEQGAKLYIEDGSGRAICYLRAILEFDKESEMYGYVGFDPDPDSKFLQTNLCEEFSIKNRYKYEKLEDILALINKK